MIFALNKDGCRVHINKALEDEIYTCPCCGGEMIQKRGKVIQHHFAHKSLVNCVSYYDNKGEWHREMQELFDEKNIEVFNNDFGKHFYDVLTDSNTIIEFQNSPISSDQFEERTKAYCNFSKLNFGRRPVWVFNYVRRYFYVYKKGEARYRRIRWYKPTIVFGQYRDNAAEYELWFRIESMKEKPEYDGFKTTYYDRRSEPGYIRVSGIYDSKYVYGFAYSEKEFFDYIKAL